MSEHNPDETTQKSPDILLEVRREQRHGDVCLIYRLRVKDDEQEFEQPLDQDPFEYFREHFEQIEELGVGTLDSKASRKAMHQLEGVGATLGARVLPEELEERHFSFYDPKRDPEESAPTLWVISDEPWVPWELLRLARTDLDGPFLGEAFAITRWLWDLTPTLALPMDRIGLVVPEPESSGLMEAAEERRFVLGLGRAGGRQVEHLEARYLTLLDAFAADRFSAWHFTGHGWAGEENPDLWSLVLDDERFQATDLKTRGSNLRSKRPLIFLNACRSARMRLALSGLGGLAQAFLTAGAGAFLGTHWAVVDHRARVFAEAFYEFFLNGDSVAEAMRQARLWLRDEFPGDPTWLAYTAFAHPLAAVGGTREPLPAPRWPGRFLESPWQEWDEHESSPGAMLRADHRIVPFHRRDEELEELRSWCEDERRLCVRLYTGAGGMGKTRLALEIFQELRAKGWRSGFVKREANDQPETAARALVADGGPMFLVIDYAETRRDLLVALLQTLLKTRKKGPFRVLLLSRKRAGWWEILKAAPERVGDLISGTATTVQSLGPLATKLADREDTFRRAARAFAHKRARPVPKDLPEDLGADYFKPVLMIHMKALGAVEDVQLKGEDGVLDWVLNRERKFWFQQARAQGIELSLVDGMGQAMAAITLAGGSPRSRDAVALFEALKFFHGVSRPVLSKLSDLLHATYPGEYWVNPLQPDILGEHLIERELEDPEVQQEIYDLVFGPRSQDLPTQ